MKKKNLFTVIILFAFFGLFFVNQAKAGPEHNVSGWAWSENIGWISFNCNNPELPSPRCTNNYGVNINSSTGVFEGYAWSRGTTDDGGIGWIKFDPVGSYPNCPISTCPAGSPNYSARVDLNTGKVTGWARVYRAIEPDGQTLGGWDGWILLGPIVKNDIDYGVSINKSTGDFSGWAWSDMVIGWINFNGTNYGVKTDFSLDQGPNTPSELSETWNDCSFREFSIPSFNWNYSHPENKAQAGYEIEIYGETTLQHVSDIPSISYIPATAWVRDNLLFGEKTYSWRVKVEDQENNWSEWSGLKNFQTRRHAYPWIDFEWVPEKLNINIETQFIDLSETFGGATSSSWNWQFPSGSYSCVDPLIGCESSQNPKIEFLSAVKEPNNKVYLTVFDSDNFSCTRNKSISVRPSFPEWREIPPQ